MLKALAVPPALFYRESVSGVTGELAVSMTTALHRLMDQLQPLPQEAQLQHWLDRIALSRDQVAFAHLFDYFAPRIKAYVLRLGVDDSTAEEILQDVMLTLWRRADRFDGAVASVGTWVFTIARNKRIDALRRRHPLESDSSDPAFVSDRQTESADRAIETRENSVQLHRALAALPAEQADILKMAYFQDKTHRTIADETCLPLGTVKSRIRLALKRLRAALKDS